VRGNTYLNDAAPWTSIKHDPDKAAVSIRTAVNLIHLQAILSSPFIPDISARILGYIDGPQDLSWPSTEINALRKLLHRFGPGYKVTSTAILIPKIDDKCVKDLEERYGR
jgi:methionyl-tRNA synthetase